MKCSIGSVLDVLLTHIHKCKWVHTVRVKHSLCAAMLWFAKSYLCVHAAALFYSVLPGNTPQGFNALDCWVFYVLKSQSPRNFGSVNTQTDLHRSSSRHRRCREAHDLWHGPPGESTKKREKYLFVVLIMTLPVCCWSRKCLTSQETWSTLL